MATVYLAEDLKHHRRVAIKVLPSELAASLAPIASPARSRSPRAFSIRTSWRPRPGDADGFFYYVMPYVEGETLRDRLARSGELPVAEAYDFSPRSPRHSPCPPGRRGPSRHRSRTCSSLRHAMVMDFGVAGRHRGHRRAQPHQRRRRTRHRRHGTGAGLRRSSHGCAGRHLRRRRDGLRDARRPHALPRPQSPADAGRTRHPAPIPSCAAANVGLLPRSMPSSCAVSPSVRRIASRPPTSWDGLEPLATPSGGMTRLTRSPCRRS